MKSFEDSDSSFFTKNQLQRLAQEKITVQERSAFCAPPWIPWTPWIRWIPWAYAQPPGIDLVPRLLYGRSEHVDVLIESGVARWEFWNSQEEQRGSIVPGVDLVQEMYGFCMKMIEDAH